MGERNYTGHSARRERYFHPPHGEPACDSVSLFPMSDSSRPQPKATAHRAPKPEGEKLGWRVLKTEYPYEGKVNKLRADKLSIPGKDEMDYSYLERAQSVIVVPVTAEGKIVLIRQYRFPVDEHCLEFPAGGMHDTGDASHEDVVRKELQEEIGADAGAVECVTWFFSSDSLSNEVCHVHLAFDVKLTESSDTEPGEHIEPIVLPAREVLALVRRGEMRTGTCALSFLLCEARLRERGWL